MPPESFLIWGAGGHGKVVYDLLHALGHRVVGWIDRDPQAFHTLQPLSDTTIRVGQEEFMELARTTGYPKGVTAVALGIGDNRARLEALTNLGALPVPSLVHPSAVVSPLASVGRGTVIFPVAVVNAGATIGDAVIINSGAIVEHECVVENGAHISPGAVLAGAARLGRCSWLGAGATVVPSTVVGANAIVGAGAVVLDDVQDAATVVGNPARLIRRPSQ